MMSAPSQIGTIENDQNYYPSVNFKNAITLLIDNNGSRDLGTLLFRCSGGIPYFKLPNGNTISLEEAGAVDTSPTNDEHLYLLNINAINISTLKYSYIKGVGDAVEPFKFCSSTDEDMTKYLVIMGAASTVNIIDIKFTFNAVPGNIGYSGAVDYRSASYDENTYEFTGASTGAVVAQSTLSIYYDVKDQNQKVGLNVTFAGSTYTVSIITDKTLLTEDLVINFFKYDNNATTLVFVVNGVSTTYYTGTVSVTVHPDLTYELTNLEVEEEP